MSRRRRGRPARADGPAFDRDAVGQLIRHGELVPQPGGPPLRQFPGPCELGRRLGVSPSTITRFAAELGVSFASRRGAAKPARARAHKADVPDHRAPSGRRPKDAAPIDWEQIDRILVEGEHTRLPNGVIIVVYPEAQELAQRYGIHPSTISRHSTKHRCLERRLEHRRKLYASAPVQLTESQAQGVADGTVSITGDPDDDLIITRRVVIRDSRRAAEAGEVRVNDPVVVREFDRLGREAHDRKYGGETENDFQQILAAARARALEGRRRFEALPLEATGMIIDATAVEVPAQEKATEETLATPDPSDA